MPPEAPASRAARLRLPSHSETRGQQQVGDDAADEHERGSAERLGALAGQLEALQRGVDGQVGQQAHGEGHDRAQPAGRDAADPRQPQHSQRDRDDADVDPEQGHQPEEGQVVGRRGHGRGDLVGDRAARARDERDLVGLALDPRLAHAHGGGPQAADRLAGAVELREGVVDRDLRDRHRVGPVVADGERDDAGREHGPLDGQLLGRRAAALAEARPAEHGEGADRGRDQRQRDESEQPGGQRPGAIGVQVASGGAVSLHHATSNWPCQPSSVNSDWWAWNMNRPACGKRHSRMPRWPWHSITVSVSSEGWRDVPVGK